MVDLWFLLRGRVRRQQLAFAGEWRRGCDMWRRDGRLGRYDGSECTSSVERGSDWCVGESDG